MNKLLIVLACILSISLASALSIEPSIVYLNISAGNEITIPINITSEASRILLYSDNGYCVVKNNITNLTGGLNRINLSFFIPHDAPVGFTRCSLRYDLLDVDNIPQTTFTPSSVRSGDVHHYVYRYRNISQNETIVINNCSIAAHNESNCTLVTISEEFPDNNKIAAFYSPLKDNINTYIIFFVIVAIIVGLIIWFFSNRRKKELPALEDYKEGKYGI